MINLFIFLLPLMMLGLIVTTIWLGRFSYLCVLEGMQSWDKGEKLPSIVDWVGGTITGVIFALCGSVTIVAWVTLLTGQTVSYP